MKYVIQTFRPEGIYHERIQKKNMEEVFKYLKKKKDQKSRREIYALRYVYPI